MCENIIRIMVNYKIIHEKDREIYIFGMLQGCILLLNVATSLVIGIIFNKPFECILMSAAYILIRIYAGGYHARTLKFCYIASTILIACGIGLINILSLSKHATLGFSFASLLAIMILAPQPSENKPLDIQEHEKYKSILHKVLVIEIVFFIFFYCIRMVSIYSAIAVAWIMVSTMLIIGRRVELLKRKHLA